MKKDILDLKVEDLAVVIAPRTEEDDEQLWDTFIINFRDEAIENVMVVSTGYGEDEKGEKRRTSTLRHFFEQISPLGMHQIEPVPTELFWMAHEYWVSFTFEGHMYDKKYVFVPGSLDKLNFMQIPFLDRRGVMIR